MLDGRAPLLYGAGGGTMKSFELRDPQALGTRSHPWSGSTTDPTLRLLDLRTSPELIRSSLEDFRPFDHFSAIQTFYRLLEWLNGPESLLESNDCAFEGPNPATPASGGRMEATGRVMLLFRELVTNTVPGRVQTLVRGLARAAHEVDPDFEGGALATGSTAVRFIGLAPGRQAGHQLLVSFWAWGDDEEEVMANLDRVFQNLTLALRS